MANHFKKHPVGLSIGILARNKETSIRATLEGLFRQSVFEQMWSHYEHTEVVVVANGCSDRTAALAHEACDDAMRRHEYSDAMSVRVVELPEPGKCNAWNRFVHDFSSLEARYLCLLDADVLFHHRESMANLVTALERRPYAQVASGRASGDILFKGTKRIWDRVAMARMEAVAPARRRSCGALYCLRAEIARRIVLPRSLGREAEFIWELLRSDALAPTPSPARVAYVPEATYLVEVPTTPSDMLAELRKQVIHETAAGVLLSFFRSRPTAARRDLAGAVRLLDQCDPGWLQRLTREQLRGRGFWTLCPGLIASRLESLRAPDGAALIPRVPIVIAELCVALAASWRAHRLLRAGVEVAQAGAVWPNILTESPSGRNQP